MKIKKIIASIMLSAVIFETPVLAADIDLSSLSVEELVDLKYQIDDELYEKQGYLDLNEGYYVVGKDIAPGEYTIKAYGEAADGGVSNAWKIKIYKSEELRKEYETASNEYMLRYSEARANRDAGVETQFPEAINIYEYVLVDEYVDFAMEYSTVLEDGNVIYFDTTLLHNKSKLVISQGTKKGLFMD